MPRRMRVMAGSVMAGWLAMAPVWGQPAPAPPPQPQAESPAAGAESAPARRELSREELQDLVNQLGAHNYDAREAAMRRLVLAGDAAVPFLKSAIRRQHMEIRWRARRALRLCEWGVLPHLERVESGLDAFLTGDSETKSRLLREWVRLYRADLLPFLRKVCLKDQSRDIREMAFQQMVGVGAARETLIELADECARGDAGATWAFRALARFYHEAGQDDEALRCLTRITESGQPDYDASAMLAEIHAARGEWEQAAKFHQVARDLAGPDQRIKHVRELARIYLKLGQTETAGAALEALLNEDSGNAENAFLLLDFYFEHNMLDKANSLVDWALDRWANDRRLADNVGPLMARVADGYWNIGAYDRLTDVLGKLVDESLNRGDNENQFVLMARVAALAWVHVQTAERPKARELLRTFADRVTDDLALLHDTWRLAERLGFAPVATEVKELAERRHGHRVLLVRADDALDARDRETARQLLNTYAEKTPNLGWQDLSDLLARWDKIGDEEPIARYVSGLTQSSGFSTMTAAELAQQMTRQDTALALLEAAFQATSRVRDVEAGRNYATTLANFKRYDEAISVVDQIVAWESVNEWSKQRMETIRHQCLAAKGDLARLRELLGPSGNSNDGMNAFTLAQFEFDAGNFDAARALWQQSFRQSPNVSALRQLMEAARRRYEFATVIELLDANAGLLRQGIDEPFTLMRAEAELTQGEFAAARQHVAELVPALGGRQFNPPEEFEVLALLLGLGQSGLVSGFTKEKLTERRRADVKLFGLDSRDSQSAHFDFLRTMAAAMVDEQNRRPAAACRKYLEAWRFAVLHYHADFVRDRLANVLDADTIAAVRDEMAEDLAAIFGPPIATGKLDVVRHSQRPELRIFAHALALSGKLDQALELLRAIAGHGLARDLDLVAAVRDPSGSIGATRGYGQNQIVDVALELVQWLLFPESIPGIADADLPALDVPADVAVARASEAWELCVRLAEKTPNDMRVLMLLDVAAKKAGRTGDRIAQAVAARLAAPDVLDQVPSYVAAFHFTMTGFYDLAIAGFRAILATPTVDYSVQSNAEEYLGRVLATQPERMAEAKDMFRATDSHVNMTGWYIDEDFYSQKTYAARAAHIEMANALARDELAASVEAARKAAFFAPKHAAFQVEYARLLMRTNQADLARARLRPWQILAEMQLRKFPADASAKRLLDAIHAIPGLDLPEVPPIDRE